MTTHTVTLTTTLTSLRALLTTAGYTNFTQNFANSDVVVHTMTGNYNVRGSNETTGAGILIPTSYPLPFLGGDCLNTLFSSAITGALLYIRID